MQLVKELYLEPSRDSVTSGRGVSVTLPRNISICSLWGRLASPGAEKGVQKDYGNRLCNLLLVSFPFDNFSWGEYNKENQKSNR